MIFYSFFFFFLYCQPSHALYTAEDDVIELTPSNFNEVKGSQELWLVEFYAPWCGHCQSLAPEWRKAASALKGVVKVAAVDMDKYGELGQPYNIKGFPTIKVFGKNKQSPTDFQGDRTYVSIVNVALKEVEQMVRSRLSGSGSGSGSTHERKSSSSNNNDGPNVIELTDNNFDDLVLKSDEPWLVEFFAPWCGHCKNLKPHWEQAANELKGKIKLGALDATVHAAIASRFGVQGYPTIKYFPAGVKSGDGLEYDGGRSASDIVRWANDKVVATLPPPELHEITDQQTLKMACEEHQLCVVSVLPNILDCQSDCRNSYIKIIKDAADKYKTNQWGWLWTEAMKQEEIEKAFSIGGFGYPAMVVVNVRKSKFATLRGPFSQTGVQEFVRDVSLGRGPTGPILGDGLPSVRQVEKWDGLDAAAPEEEEIDLSELGIDTPKVEL